MMRLTLAALSQAIWPWPLIGMLAWLAVGLFSIQPQHGDYLAWASGAVIIIIFRFASISETRRRCGWWLEERLRDRSGLRLPTAEFLAASIASALILSIASAPYFSSDKTSSADVAIHPLVVAQKDQNWLVSFPNGRLPQGSSISLLIEWDTLPSDDLGFTPGKEFKRPLSESEANLGRVIFELPEGARIHPEFARAIVIKPGFDAYPNLFFRQWLFFLPLLALTLLFVRLKIRSFIAGLGALSVGGLGLWNLPVYSHEEGLRGILVLVIEKLSLLLPNLNGLYVGGVNYEISIGANSPFDLAWWMMLGLGFLFLSTRTKTWDPNS